MTSTIPPGIINEKPMFARDRKSTGWSMWSGKARKSAYGVVSGAEVDGSKVLLHLQIDVVEGFLSMRPDEALRVAAMLREAALSAGARDPVREMCVGCERGQGSCTCEGT